MKNEPINNAPLVTIITPLFNAENFIAQTMASVQNQTYKHWEHILVDDASSDTSADIAEAIAKKDARIQIIKRTENKGAAFCRNHATNLAKGEYIAFLDSDDLWHPEKLEQQISFMRARHCDVSYTNYLHVDVEGKSLGKRINALPELSYNKQQHNNYVGNLTGMYHAASVGKILAPGIRKRQDWAVWLEAIKRSGQPALGLQEDLAYYRVRKGSISANKFNLIKYNFLFYRKYLSYSWLRSAAHLVRFFWEYFLIRPRQIEKF